VGHGEKGIPREDAIRRTEGTPTKPSCIRTGSESLLRGHTHPACRTHPVNKDEALHKII